MAKIGASRLAEFASQLGVVEDTEEGRRSFVEWLRRDAAEAQHALCLGIDARTLVGSAEPGTRSLAPADASAEEQLTPKEYPTSWQPTRAAAPGLLRPDVAALRQSLRGVEPETVYPVGWLTSAETRRRVVEMRGGTPSGSQPVHTPGNASTYIEAARQTAEATTRASQANTFGIGYHDPHRSVAAAGDNARRLEELRRIEEARMEREVWSRT